MVKPIFVNALLAIVLASNLAYGQQLSGSETGQTDLIIGPAPTALPKKEQELFTPRNKVYYIKIHQIADKIISIVSSLNVFALDNLIKANHEAMSLLDFEYSETPEISVEAYEREHHFGGWVKNKKSGDCFNTRNKVLVRENIGTLALKDENKCSVASGEWIDPYSGNKMTDAMAEIQIDHMVPLREAYVSGAHKWTFKERCLYGNYLGYRNHLVAVSGDENNEKSAKTPDDYMPSNIPYSCEYLKDWLKIKSFWGLSLVPEEVKSIKRLVDEHHCDVSQMVVTKKEIQEQEVFFKANAELCRVYDQK